MTSREPHVEADAGEPLNSSILSHVSNTVHDFVDSSTHLYEQHHSYLLYSTLIQHHKPISTMQHKMLVECNIIRPTVISPTPNIL